MMALCVSVQEAADALGVSPWVVRSYIASRLLPTVVLPSVKRPGERSRRILISVQDLADFVAKHREVGA